MPVSEGSSAEHARRYRRSTDRVKLILKVTSHERWFLARRNAGYPFIITILITYPTSALPTESHLLDRITELQTHFRHLNAPIKDSKTRRPYWEERPVVRPACEHLNRTLIGQTQAELISNEHDRMEREDYEGGRPLWQVSVGEGAETRSYIAVSATHELIDGRGLLRLVRALLDEDISNLPYESLSTVSTYPDSIDIRPSWSYLLPFALSEILNPWLPRFVTSYLSSQVWPVGLQRTNPLELPARLSLLNIPLRLADLLKSLGKFHGVPTLTPILFTAWLIAMKSVLTTDLPLAGSIAVDERRSALKHSYCMSLYHASHLYSVDLTDSSSFWTTARHVAIHIATPSSLTVARMRMGMTAWVPDGDVPAARRSDHRPTAWEDWQLERNTSLNSYNSSVSFSNLGKVDLPKGAEDIIVASSASVGDPPIKLVLTGTQEGINVAITFRHGDILGDIQVEEMSKKWVSYLEQLVSGQGEDLTMGELNA